MKLHHLTSLQICVVATGLLAILQSSVLAQPNNDATTANSTAAIAVRVSDDFITPELPPIKPILPFANEIRLELRLNERRVYVYQGDRELSSYSVAIGRPGWETPVGTFEVMRMVRYPTWIFPDIINPETGRRHESAGESVLPGAENPLGDRWIGFTTLANNSIGFHGTPNPESIGQAASHGCVRMYNEDVRELFNLVEIGTPVIVRP